MDADKADAVILSESKEHSELPEAADGVAQIAHDDDVAPDDPIEHLPPLGTHLFLDRLLLYDAVASEVLHPGEVLFTGGEGHVCQIVCQKRPKSS